MNTYIITLIENKPSANTSIREIKAETAQDALTFIEINEIQKSFKGDGKPTHRVFRIEAKEG